MGDYTAKKIDDMEGFYKGLFRKARDEDIRRQTSGPEPEPLTSAVCRLPSTVRIGPNTKRKINPGADGMRLLAIGGVAGEAYEAPGYTEVGAPDPLA